MVSHVRTEIERDNQQRAIQALEVSITQACLYLSPSLSLSLSHNNDLKTNDIILYRLRRCFKRTLLNHTGFNVINAHFCEYFV